MKIYKKILITICIVSIVASLYSFKRDIETVFTEEEMVDIHKEIDLRVTAFIANEKRICREELIEMVDTEVDTILMFNAPELVREDEELKDNTPLRPEPPQKPELVKPTDDTPLKPLIEDKEEVFK